MDTEKFFLRWNEFEENIRQSFKVLRDEGKLFDVTLATDDGYQIQAHRVILCAGSNFFSDIFGKCNQTNMLVYLKGVRRAELLNIADFLYDGKTSVAQNELNAFLETAQELKLKGLQNEDNVYEKINIIEASEVKLESRLIKTNVDNYVAFLDDENDSLAVQQFVAKQEAEKPHPLFDNDLDLESRLEELIEKSVNNWQCRICSKTFNTKRNMIQHSEIHVEGITHSCNVCMKTFSTKHSLRVHMSKIHSNLYFCGVCGKRNMNKMHVQTHKSKNECPGVPQEQLA